MKVLLPSQSGSELSAKPGFSNSTQGDPGKGTSFLQILRPKAGLKGEPETSSSVQTASKAIVSIETLRHTPQANSTAKSSKETKNLSAEKMPHGSQSPKKTKKQANGISDMVAPIAQVVQQTVSKAKAISINKQPGTTSNNLVKQAKRNVVEGQAGQAKKQPEAGNSNLVKTAQFGQVKMGLRNPVINKNEAALQLTNRNNSLVKPEIVKRTKTAFPRPVAERKSLGQLPENASVGVQNKRSSGATVVDRAHANDSRKDILFDLKPRNKGSMVSVQKNNEPVSTVVRGLITKGETIKGEPSPDKQQTITPKEALQGGVKNQSRDVLKSLTPVDVRSELYNNTAKSEVTKPTRLKQLFANPKGGGSQYPQELATGKSEKISNPDVTPLPENAQNKRIGKIELLERKMRGSLQETRLDELRAVLKSRASREGVDFKLLDKNQANNKVAVDFQNSQQQGKVASAQSSELEVYGVKNKFNPIGKTDNQSLIKRDVAVHISHQRILKGRMSSVPNTLDALKEPNRQINLSRARETIAEALTNQVAQLTGLQSFTPSKNTLILGSGDAKKASLVTHKRSQRILEMAKAASAKKSAKTLMPKAKADNGAFKVLAGGMEDAFLKSDMNLARKMEQSGSLRQNLPFGERFASVGVEKHASVAAEMIEAGRSDLSHIRDLTVRNDFANRLNQADVELQSIQSKTTPSKGQSSVNAVMYRQVMSAVETFRGMNTSRWAMTIEPFSNLRMQLDLRMSDARLVVQAKLERGSQAVIGNGWSELQASLAEKDVDLRSLITANSKEGHGNMFGGKNERQSGGAKQDDEAWFSEELSDLLAEFEKGSQEQGKAKRNKRKARMSETMFESWA